MTIDPETIDHAKLQQLVAGGGVHDVEAIGQRGGWIAIVKDGVAERVLVEQHGTARTFRQLDTLVHYLKDVGISVFHVNAVGFDSRRPNLATRVDNESEEIAHTEWMREKVAEALADPRPNITNEQVMTELQAVIDAARKKRALKAAS